MHQQSHKPQHSLEKFKRPPVSNYSNTLNLTRSDKEFSLGSVLVHNNRLKINGLNSQQSTQLRSIYHLYKILPNPQTGYDDFMWYLILRFVSSLWCINIRRLRSNCSDWSKHRQQKSKINQLLNMPEHAVNVRVWIWHARMRFSWKEKQKLIRD